ncbi:MAG TPA: LpqB family beta-propeller domain-containing protein [bacterium]|nr:LpqB family beta-propeller domain-containing protein [bacterium]
MKVKQNNLRSRFRIGLFTIAALIGFGSAGIVSAQDEANHPELEWKTLKTDHFEVHFHSGAERTARTVAKIAEDIYAPITDLYDWEPDGIVHFIIKDFDDNSNGAAYYYDNKVEIWAPQMSFILRGTHNWLRNVVTHEFSHMISLGATRRMPRRIPAFYLQMFDYEEEKRPDVLYGYPNVIASFPLAHTIIPMWLAEGMAQYMAPGLDYDRWDSHRDMLIRTAMAAEQPLSFDEMGVFGKSSLGNERTYNSGYAFTRYIAQTWGEDALRQIARNLRKPWTCSVDGALEQVTGLDAQTVYSRWQQSLKSYYSRRLQSITANPVEGKVLTPKGMGNIYPAWSPDGKRLAYSGGDNGDYLTLTHLQIYDLETQKAKTVKAGVNSTVSWSPDGSRLLYSRIDKTQNHSYFSDLFIYDLTNKKEKRLTTAARANSPAWSADGQRIAAIVQGDGSDNLVIWNSDGKDPIQLTNFRNGEALFTPSWAPDGQQIVFSRGRNHGRDLCTIDIQTRQLRTLVQDEGDARDPVFASSGKQIYFSWDRSGIFNIYSIDLVDSTFSQWTNVVGGAFMPTLSAENKIAFANFQVDGYKIALLENPEPLSSESTEYLAVDEQVQLGLAGTSANGDDAALVAARQYDDSRLPDMEANPYRRTYGQITFLPRLMIDYQTVKVGTYFYASDIIDKYSIFGGVVLNRQMDLDAFALFELRSFKPTLFLELYGYTRNIEREISVIEDYPEQVRVDIGFRILEADIGAEYRINRMLRMRTYFAHSRYSSKIKDFFFQNVRWVSPLNTYFKGSNLTSLWELDQTVPGVLSQINPSAGRKISFKASYQLNDFFEDYATNNDYGTLQELYTQYDYPQLELRWIEYLRNPLLPTHGITVDLQAGWIDRPVDSFFHFYAGGMPGLRGYPFYSIDGRKLLVGRFTYRWPIFSHWQKRFLHLTTDKLFMGVFFDMGDAFNADRIAFSEMKKDAGVNLRFSSFSFYGYPAAVSFDAAYGFDSYTYRRLQDVELRYGKEWRFYVNLLFDFLD